MDTHPRVSSSEYFKYGVVVLAWRMKRGRLAAELSAREAAVGDRECAEFAWVP